MRFTCNKKLLLSAVMSAGLAASGKSTIPSLEGLLFEAGQGLLTVTGYDLELGIRVVVGADVQKEGIALINAQKISSIIKNMPDGNIIVEVDEKYVARIVCATSSFEIHTMPSDSFPSIPEVANERSIRIGQGTLKRMIAQTSFAIAVNNPRPVFNGALFEVEGSALRIVALDGFRLALRYNKTGVSTNATTSFSFIVPGKTLSELQKLLGDEEEQVEMELSRKSVVFSMGNITFFSRLIDGEFFDYRAFVNQEVRTEAVVKRSELISCVERAMLLNDDKNKGPFRCVFENGSLKINCVTPLGRVNDELNIKFSGEVIEIGFNCRTLYDTLKALGEEKIRLQMCSPIKSMVVVPDTDYNTDKDDYLYLVLPLKLKSTEV
ncbi:MAG: DNA polymerase III subunit beta [Eubacteriales bacterium]